MAGGASLQLVPEDRVLAMEQRILDAIDKKFESLKNSTVEKSMLKNDFAREVLKITPQAFDSRIRKGKFPPELIHDDNGIKRIFPSEYNQWLKNKKKKS
jgi:hypothetical protein